MIISEQDLTQLLIKNNIIAETDLPGIISYAKNSGIDFAEALVEKNIISDENLNLLIADFMKFPYIVLSKISIPEDISHIIPEKIARRKKVIAFARDQAGIKVAMVDPRDTEVLTMIEKKTGEKVFPYFTSERDITNSFKIYKRDLQKTFDSMIKEVMSKIGTTVANDAPIAKIVDLLVNFAYQYRTSDIHIEPQEGDTVVRFRMDGVLHDVLTLPKVLHDRVVTRVKVLSRLRTDEHLSAQDGKMRVQLEEENLDIRVSILPIADGEKVVLRLLASQSSKFSLSNLGMNDKDLKKITDAINKSYGMILSTGPTGSGKSTSIYVVLKILNSREKNITTIEDPVEYRLKGINQIQVNTKTGLTFANGLRSILRQDPNVIFVGEIRDNETAGIAINAALTGHLVLSTLHTNDAATSLPRLTDMKIEPFLVASTINVIIAQRLLRKNCDMCKSSITISSSDLSKQIPAKFVEHYFGTKDSYTIYKGKGCKVCHGTGYNGRIGLFEVLEVSKAIKELITQKADSMAIVQKAIEEGMTTMLEDGIDKVTKGITSLEEVLRITKVESE